MTAISILNIDTPVTIKGNIVRLEPIGRQHIMLFWNVAHDGREDTFRWIPFRMQTLEDFQCFVDKALTEQERGESIVFATVEASSGRLIGSTRFMNIDRANRRVEIGSTWIATPWRRSGVNTEAKYLMLCHAFEVWKCSRVELKTDAL